MKSNSNYLDIFTPENFLIQLTWVDDVWEKELPFLVIQKALNAPESNSTKMLSNSFDFKYIIIFKQLCEILMIKFRIANFQYFQNLSEEHINSSNEYFLLDIFNENIEGGNIYGINLAKEKNLSLNKFKFWSSHPTEIVNIKGLGYDPDQAFAKTWPLESVEEEVRKWLNSLLVHDDLTICQFLDFYSQPWRKQGEKWHQGAAHNSEAQVQKLREFLKKQGIEVDV